MKKLLTTVALVAATVTAFSQGQVAFQNSSTTIIRDNVTGTGVTPAGAYLVGLYMQTAAAFTGEQSMVLVGIATNTALAGRFSGGNPFTTPGFPGIDATTVGTNLWHKFQFRAWSNTLGLRSYEEAFATGNPNVKAGVSAIGFVAPGNLGDPGAFLTGTGAGQLNTGFTVFPVPEPSIILLGMIGASLLWIRRRKAN